MIELAAKSASSAPSWVSYLSLAIAAASASAIVWNRWHEAGKARRRFAESVAAWSGPHVDCPHAAEQSYHWHDVLVRNGGEQPIFNVVVTVEVPHATDLLEGETGPAMLAVGLVPPGETVSRGFSDQGQEAWQFAGPLEMAFTDASGQRWRRDGQGRLRRGKG